MDLALIDPISLLIYIIIAIVVALAVSLITGRPVGADPEGEEEFNITTVAQNTPITEFFGRGVSKGHVVWFGEIHMRRYREESVTVGRDHSIGVCWIIGGKIDALIQFRIKNKVSFPGPNNVQRQWGLYQQLPVGHIQPNNNAFVFNFTNTEDGYVTAAQAIDQHPLETDLGTIFVADTGESAPGSPRPRQNPLVLYHGDQTTIDPYLADKMQLQSILKNVSYIRFTGGGDRHEGLQLESDATMKSWFGTEGFNFNENNQGRDGNENFESFIDTSALVLPQYTAVVLRTTHVPEWPTPKIGALTPNGGNTGNGTITEIFENLSPGVSETWTIAIKADPTKFSITGDVTGLLALEGIVGILHSDPLGLDLLVSQGTVTFVTGDSFTIAVTLRADASIIKQDGDHDAAADGNGLLFSYYIFRNMLELPVTSFDRESFQDAANTILTEKMGISFEMSSFRKAEDYINEIKKHLDLVIFIDTLTGKIKAKLIRDDYGPVSGLIPINETDVFDNKLIDKSPEAIATDVIFTRTSRESLKQLAVRETNDAAKGIVTNVQPKKLSFPYCTREETLDLIIARNLVKHFKNLTEGTFKLPNDAGIINPGDVRKFSNANEGFTDLPIRILEVEGGTLDDPIQEVTWQEDIYSLGALPQRTQPDRERNPIFRLNHKIIDFFIRDVPFSVGWNQIIFLAARPLAELDVIEQANSFEAILNGVKLDGQYEFSELGILDATLAATDDIHRGNFQVNDPNDITVRANTDKEWQQLKTLAIIEDVATNTEPLLTGPAGAAPIGNGTITGHGHTNIKVAEIWTITALADPRIWSVSGSVSGTRANAATDVDYDNGMIQFRIIEGATIFVTGDFFSLEINSASTRVGAVTDPAPANIGNGTVTGVIVQDATLGQRWTLSCQIGGGAGVAVFGVFALVNGINVRTDLATVGTLFDNGEISFTINAGGVDFINARVADTTLRIPDNFQIDVENFIIVTPDGGNTGNGIISKPTNEIKPSIKAIDQVWTLVCIDDSVPGSEIFSVTGSISLAQPNATVDVPFDSLIQFTINDGAIDFAVGDTWTFNWELDNDYEIVSIKSVADNGDNTFQITDLIRGIGGTTIKLHLAGARLWIIKEFDNPDQSVGEGLILSDNLVDLRMITLEEILTFRINPVNSFGSGPPTDFGYSYKFRPEKPFPVDNLTAKVFDIDGVNSAIEFTWKLRIPNGGARNTNIDETPADSFVVEGSSIRVISDEATPWEALFQLKPRATSTRNGIQVHVLQRVNFGHATDKTYTFYHNAAGRESDGVGIIVIF